MEHDILPREFMDGLPVREWDMKDFAIITAELSDTEYNIPNTLFITAETGINYAYSIRNEKDLKEECAKVLQHFGTKDAVVLMRTKMEYWPKFKESSESHTAELTMITRLIDGEARCSNALPLLETANQIMETLDNDTGEFMSLMKQFAREIGEQHEQNLFPKPLH